MFASVLQRLGRQLETFAQREQVALSLFLGMDVPATPEGLEHELTLFRVEHLFRARDQRHIGQPGLKVGEGLV